MNDPLSPAFVPQGVSLSEDTNAILNRARLELNQSPRRTLPPPALTTARVTALFKFHYEIPGEGVQSPEEMTYSEQIGTLDAAYERKVTIGTDWEEIDFGWLVKTHDKISCSFLYVKNVYKPWRDRASTPAEQEDAVRHVLEIGVAVIDLVTHVKHVVPVSYVPWGFAVALCPMSPGTLSIRCQQPDGRYLVFAVPEEEGAVPNGEQG